MIQTITREWYDLLSQRAEVLFDDKHAGWASVIHTERSNPNEEIQPLLDPHDFKNNRCQANLLVTEMTAPPMGSRLDLRFPRDDVIVLECRMKQVREHDLYSICLVGDSPNFPMPNTRQNMTITATLERRPLGWIYKESGEVGYFMKNLTSREQATLTDAADHINGTFLLRLLKTLSCPYTGNRRGFFEPYRKPGETIELAIDEKLSAVVGKCYLATNPSGADNKLLTVNREAPTMVVPDGWWAIETSDERRWVVKGPSCEPVHPNDIIVQPTFMEAVMAEVEEEIP